jgi:hypothetical protein
VSKSAQKAKKKYVRRRSGTAKWHMSREAVNLPLADIYKLDEYECWKLFVEARFGGKDTVRCPYCGSIGTHYFRLHDRRWKCHGCKSTFTVTTGTMFAQHKLSLRDLLIGALPWVLAPERVICVVIPFGADAVGQTAPARLILPRTNIPAIDNKLEKTQLLADDLDNFSPRSVLPVAKCAAVP